MYTAPEFSRANLGFCDDTVGKSTVDSGRRTIHLPKYFHLSALSLNLLQCGRRSR